MPRQPYLDAVDERVVVFDGAFGTYVQNLDLSADDFGGPALEGCNEMLCLTRPDVIRGMHAAFFDAGVDVVLECSGRFRTPEALAGHFDRGVRKVIVAAPVTRPLTSMKRSFPVPGTLLSMS